MEHGAVNATLTDRSVSSDGAPASAPTAGPIPPPSTRPPLPPLHLDVAATLALAAYSAVVALGFARVFSRWSFVSDLFVLIAFGHGGSLLLRRLRVSSWLAVPTMLVASVWLLLARQYRVTFRWLLPSGETWRLVDLQLDLVRTQFQTAVAPVVYDIGWALLAGFAAGNKYQRGVQAQCEIEARNLAESDRLQARKFADRAAGQQAATVISSLADQVMPAPRCRLAHLCPRW